MYKRFNLDLQSNNSSFIAKIQAGSTSFYKQSYHEIGDELYKKHIREIKDNLTKFENMSAELSGNDIMEKWFPEIEADIFLSHSHQDKKLVIAFAGWLKHHFNLTAFIDSSVWGYADNLLKIIDKKYCWNSDTQTYSYSKRNYSTSHVHMMLSTALMNMMDRCECIIFVNTPKSFTPEEEIHQGTTLSPWIFSEITMSQLLRQTEPNRSTIAMDAALTTESLEIKYSMDLNHLISLTVDNLKTWEQRVKNHKGPENLDILYKISEEQSKK